MVYGYIYCILNTTNGKRYIGQTTQNVEDRKYQHFYELKNGTHGNVHLQFAFNKYGKSNFEFMVLNYATNKETLDSLEEEYIKKYRVLINKNGYNLQSGGSHGKLSLETRQKISKNHGSRRPEVREKLSKSHKGKIFSEEHKRKLGLVWKGRKHSEETKRKMSKSQKGRIFSKEHCLRLSISHKGSKNPMYGRKHSEETRLKLKEVKRGSNNPMHGKSHSKETKIKLSKSVRKSTRGKGLFGFTGILFRKDLNPENRPWGASIYINKRLKHLGYFHDPLTCEIIHDLVLDALFE